MSGGSAALVVSLWGQDAGTDPGALAALRQKHEGLRLYGLCLEGAPGVEAGVFDRVVRLPLGQQHLGHAESIALQLALNEGNQFAGVTRSLSLPDIHKASVCLGALAARRADAIVVPEADALRTRLFVSQRAAFLASFWGALAEAFPASRVRLASALLGLAGRSGAQLTRSGPALGLAPLQPVDIREFAPQAQPLGSKLGLVTNGRLPAIARPVHRVAVVTPYYKEPDAELGRAIASVRTQSLACDHIMVSDGFPNPLAEAPGLTHIELGRAHADNGNTPRYVGAMVALAKGYDAIAFLDADNWFERKHVQRLVECQHETKAAAVFSLRNIHLPDGFKLPDIDDEDGRRRHVDTSCILLTQGCEYAVHLWGQMPQEWGPVCDRVIFAALHGLRLAWTGNRTLNFKSNYAAHYRLAKRPVPETVHDVPRSLWRDFATQADGFRQRSISRTGRPITLRR